MPNQAVLQCEVSVFHCAPFRIPLYPDKGHSGTLLGAVISCAFMQIILSKIVMKTLKFTWPVIMLTK